MKSGKYCAKFYVTEDGNHNGSLMLGATKEKRLLRNNIFSDSYTYCYCGSNGRLYGQQIPQQHNFITLKEHDSIEIFYDIDNRTIKYAINGKMINNMFTNVETPLYPYCELCGQYTTISLKLVSFVKDNSI